MDCMRVAFQSSSLKLRNIWPKFFEASKTFQVDKKRKKLSLVPTRSKLPNCQGPEVRTENTVLMP